MKYETCHSNYKKLEKNGWIDIPPNYKMSYDMILVELVERGV